METQVGKWGNSLAIRIPRGFVKEARLDEGVTVELRVSLGQLIVTPIRRDETLDGLVAGITPENRHAESDWGPPAGDEVW